MISLIPEEYKKENENKSLEELVTLRIKLFNEIVEYEQKHIMDNQPYTNEEVAKPSASDIYNMNNEYLKVITDLIWEKKTGRKFNSLAYSEDEEYIEEMEEIEQIMFSKDCFFLEIRSGAVLPIEHPKYYDGRIDITIDEQFNELNSSIKIQKDEYTIDREQLSKIKALIKKQFDDLIEISKKQTTEMHVGDYNTILIKINSILLNLSLDNVTSEDDLNILNNLKNDIMSIIIPKDNKDIDKIIKELVNKIIALPKGTEISMRQLLENEFSYYNTNELFHINKSVLSICKEKGIVFNFDKYKDMAVGLPFNIPFIISDESPNLKSDYLEFYKKNDNDTIWWVNNRDTVGEHLFSFDKQKVFNLFRDYPHELTPEEKEIFDKENQFWANFFKDRNDNNSGKILNCPICENTLMFMEPDGNTLWCNKCNKYFANNNGSVGSETSSPYNKDDVLY